MIKILVTTLALIIIIWALYEYVIVPLFFPKSDSKVSTLEELNARASKYKEEREVLKQELSSAEEVLQEIKSKTV